MRGKSIPLTVARRLVVDLTTFAVPSVPVQRVMDISRLVKARGVLNERPPWSVLFVKAYALVARDMPMLRQAYVKLPWPHLYEYPISTVSFVVEREEDGEQIILTTLIRSPDEKPIGELMKRVRDAKTQPVRDNLDFKRMLQLGRLPLPLRRFIWYIGLNLGRPRGNYFGTFGLTVYSGLGAESLHPIAPLTAVMNYGVIGDDGKVTVRIMYDHRVLDGSNVARILGQIEDKLNTDVLSELEAMASPQVASGKGTSTTKSV